MTHSTRDKGRWAESLSDDWFTSLGAKVVAKNRRLASTEFDRIYDFGSDLWWVEIKSCQCRSQSAQVQAAMGLDRASMWLGGRQCHRQQRVVQAWCESNQASRSRERSVRHVLVVLIAGSNGVRLQAYETCSGLLLQDGHLCV